MGCAGYKFGRVGKHKIMVLKPTSAITQLYPNPRKTRLDVQFWPVFAAFSWVELAMGYDVRRHRYNY